MRSDGTCRCAWMATLVVAMCTPLHAQVLTLGQALSQAAAPQVAPAAASTARSPAKVHLNALYGRDGQLLASLSVNGKVVDDLVPGALARQGHTACRVLGIRLASRCVAMQQASATGDLCPRQVCWTGEPEEAVDAPLTDGHAPVKGPVLTMPPVPVPMAAPHPPAPK